ncbi:MAG: TraB/GumN family protein [Wenzhouxiangella sp.]|nr:TraB/GumN family protein [Wenzhouxiangella sp.]MCH8476740.1 TraB/GumN family protein [Wenzhouxiangella sp.]
MRILPCLLLSMLLCSASAQAQVFWSVTDDAGRQNWLLGTVHSEDPRLLEFRPELLDALRASNRLALELVPDAAMLERLNREMHFDSPQLPEVLDEELYRQVVDLMESTFGMGEPAVARMRPWAVAMTLSLPPPETGLFMDLALSFRAAGMGKQVMALETLDEQLSFLTGLSEEAQIDMIRQAVVDFDRIPEMFEQLISTYLSGDLKALERLSFEQLDELDPEVRRHFYEVGLVERNQVMLERSRAYLADGGLMIAVGALHLPGEHGLIQLLRNDGFSVEGVY